MEVFEPLGSATSDLVNIVTGRPIATGHSSRAVAREQLCEHVSSAAGEQAIMKETCSVPGLYNED
jgi:hypothetical protein